MRMLNFLRETEPASAPNLSWERTLLFGVGLRAFGEERDKTSNLVPGG